MNATDTRCAACIDHPGWTSSDNLRRSEPRDTCRSCFGSGAAQRPGDTREDVTVLDVLLRLMDSSVGAYQLGQTVGRMLRLGQMLPAERERFDDSVMSALVVSVDYVTRARHWVAYREGCVNGMGER